MARLANMCAAVFVVSTASAFGNGCAPIDEAERFREPLPVQEEVALNVPGNGTATTRQGLSIATTDTTTAATARYYQLTRDFTTGVDLGTAMILGGVWAIAQT